MNIYGAITEKLEMMRSQKQPLTLVLQNKHS